MKNMVKWLGVIALVAVIGFTFVACGESGGSSGNPQPLAVPSNLQIDGTTLTWDAVNNANGYLVDIDSTEYLADTNSYSILTLTTPGTYTIKVKAIGDGMAFTDSGWSDTLPYVKQGSTQLATPSNLRINGNALMWNNVNNASAYLIDIDGTEYPVISSGYLLSALPSPGTYTIKIKATGNGTTFSDSGWSSTITYTAEAGLLYTLINDGTAYSVSKGTSFATVITIPPIYSDLPVVAIPTDGFKDYTNLTSITLPDSVTSIGQSAFDGCTSLTSITIGDRVTSIGGRAFSACRALTSITIPDSVTSIGDQTFENCTHLTSITIPDNVESLGSSVFNGCTRLTSAIIGDSVTSIGGSVFYGCRDLESVTIGDSVASIGEDAFTNCSSLRSVTIPDSVTSIGKFAFYGCSGLTDITIPFVGATKTGTANTHFGYIFGMTDYNSPRTIPTSLKTVIITGGNIGTNAFRGCSGLTSVTIGNSVTGIGNNAFNGCGLNRVTIGNSVMRIGDNAFYGCNLISVTFATGINITYFSENAFSDNINGSGLRTAYLSYGAGTYTRPDGENTWTKESSD
jgi:hypothetical protein